MCYVACNISVWHNVKNDEEGIYSFTWSVFFISMQWAVYEYSV